MKTPMTAKHPKVVKEWTELAQGYLFDGPAKRSKQTNHKAFMFINRCALKRRKDTTTYLLRDHTVETLEATSRRALDRKIFEFVQRPDVRLLAEGIETNDFDLLPKKLKNPAPNIVNGTAKIYAPRQEAGL